MVLKASAGLNMKKTFSELFAFAHRCIHMIVSCLVTVTANKFLKRILATATTYVYFISHEIIMSICSKICYPDHQYWLVVSFFRFLKLNHKICVHG